MVGLMDERCKKKRCPHCKKLAWYSDKWDALFCKDCDVWLEKGCSVTKEEIEKDPYACVFNCWKRPKKPSDR